MYPSISSRMSSTEGSPLPKGMFLTRRCVYPR